MTKPSELPAVAIGKSKAGPSKLSFPVSGAAAHSIVFTFKSYSHQSHRPLLGLHGDRTVGVETTEKIIGSIRLPLPQNIQDTFSLRVQGTELGMKGALAAGIASAATNGKGVLSAIGGFIKNDVMAPAADVASSFFGGNAASQDNMAQVRALLRRAVDESGLGKSIDVATGNILNPHMVIMFDGMDLKNHTFNWSLAPQSEADSEVLRQIQFMIRRNILPSYQNVGPLQKGLLNFPSLVDIHFEGIDRSYYLYYKTAMVQSFTMDFTPNGVAVLKHGRPAFVNLSMTLTETSIHTAEDYDIEGL